MIKASGSAIFLEDAFEEVGKVPSSIASTHLGTEGFNRRMAKERAKLKVVNQGSFGVSSLERENQASDFLP